MALEASKQRLINVFGKAASGDSPSDFARTSEQEFFRSQDHLAPAREGATGRRLTAWEAYCAFGLEKLEEAFEYGSAIIVGAPREPAETLRRRREDLGLDRADIAKAINVDEEEVARLEDPKKRSSIFLLEKAAQALALDETTLIPSPIDQNP